MTVEELIIELENQSGGNMRREVSFNAEIECQIQDERNVISLTFDTCSVSTDHPNKLEIFVCN